MVDDLLSLNLGENLVRIANASNDGGKINANLLVEQVDLPAFYESDTKKVTEETVLSVKKILYNLKINKRTTNIVIPDGFTYSQMVYMPKLKEKELLSAIRFQADQFIPMPIDETSLDVEILHEDKTTNKSLVLIIAAPQKLVERVENFAEQIGLFPESIENELSATGRFLENFYKPPNETGGAVFINFGYSYTSFYYFDHKLKLLIDSHSFPAGFAVFLREAQADINVDLAKAKELLRTTGFSAGTSLDLNQILQPAVDALTIELQKFINSLRNKHQVSAVSKLYVFNLVSQVKNLEKKLEKNISIPTSVFDPLPFCKKTPAVDSNGSNLTAFISTIGGSLK